LEKAKFDGWVALLEPLDETRNYSHSKGCQESNRDSLPNLLVSECQSATRIVQLCDCPLDVLPKKAPRIVQSHAPACSIEQARSVFLLKPDDAATERRLRNV
jgi:hypothetical protein